MLQELILPNLFRIKYFADCHHTTAFLEQFNLKKDWFISFLDQSAVKSAKVRICDNFLSLLAVVHLL